MPLGRGKKGQDAKEKELRAELAAGPKDVDIFDPKIQNAPPSDKPWEFKPFPGRKEITDSDLFIMYYIRCMNKRIPYYYRDRCGVTRGPATIPIMKEAWINGLIDENTLVWGQGQVEYLPIKNVRYLTGQIRSPEVRLCTWFKKQLVIKPALARARKARQSQRPQQYLSPQVMRMF